MPPQGSDITVFTDDIIARMARAGSVPAQHEARRRAASPVNRFDWWTALGDILDVFRGGGRSGGNGRPGDSQPTSRVPGCPDSAYVHGCTRYVNCTCMEVGPGTGTSGGSGFGSSQGSQTPCIWPWRRNSRGECVPPDLDPGTGGGLPGDAGDEFGALMYGRYGTALVPAEKPAVRLKCPRGAVLGKDDLCYNKRSISNRDRKWPASRRPLGTPGELAAIAKAARFGRRLKTQEKRLSRLGRDLAPKRPARRASKPKQPMMLPPAGTVVVSD